MANAPRTEQEGKEEEEGYVKFYEGLPRDFQSTGRTSAVFGLVRHSEQRAAV